MDVRWTQIMNGISYLKPESINKESLLTTLRMDRTYDEQVIDSLYTLKIIDFNEYIEFMQRITEIEKDKIKWIERKIEDAKEKKDKYDPMVYYGFGSNFLEAINKKINQWNDNKS